MATGSRSGRRFEPGSRRWWLDLSYSRQVDEGGPDGGTEGTTDDGTGTPLPAFPLPPQPADVPWPTDRWPTGEPPPALLPLLDQAFDPPSLLGTTNAVAVVHHGRLVAQRYGGALPRFDGPPQPVTPDTGLLSWSMAKAMLHAVVGIAADDGLVDLEGPASVPEWRGLDDPRGAITLQHLLAMRDGLDFAEVYTIEKGSDVVEMLFGNGQDDMAAFAAHRPLAAPPGTRFSYSSGTSNLVSGIVARAIGPGEPYRRYLHQRLFGPIGASSAVPTFDPAGTWVASSYVHATTQDFARFGLLYLRDGVWEGQRLLPVGWVDHARLQRSVDAESGHGFGAHWWVVGDRYGTFWTSGYEGQSITVSPALDLVVVRLGLTTEEEKPALEAWRARMIEAFA
jgi:CubicO group peptidase (beta-lactamase class C family)